MTRTAATASSSGEGLRGAWHTSDRTTRFLVERIPLQLWREPIPGLGRKTVATLAAHLHNSRRSWIRTLGQEHGISWPDPVDRHTASRREVVTALRKSGKGIDALLVLGLASGGSVPMSKGYVWRNLPLDVAHVLSYFVAHEAHHRGQIVMIARQLGVLLPREATDGLWQWNRRSLEA